MQRNQTTFTFFGANPKNIYKTVREQTKSVREQLKDSGVQDSENINLVFKFADSNEAALSCSHTFFSSNTDLLPENTTVHLIHDPTGIYRGY